MTPKTKILPEITWEGVVCGMNVRVVSRGPITSSEYLIKDAMGADSWRAFELHPAGGGMYQALVNTLLKAWGRPTQTPAKVEEAIERLYSAERCGYACPDKCPNHEQLKLPGVS